MNLTVSDILEFLENVAPSSLAEKNDPIGLQVGSKKALVKGILLTVDPSLSACKFAIDQGLNLIVSHHPLFYNPVQSLTPDAYPGSVAYFAVKEGLNLIAWHTPLDKVSWGVSAALAERLGLSPESPILSETSLGEGNGLGVLVKFSKSVKLGELAKEVAKKVNSWVMMVGDENCEVDSLGICGGSCSFLMEHLKKLSVKTLLTSDVKYHTAKQAEEEGFNFLIVDHGVAESFVLPKLKERLNQFLSKRGFQVPIVIFTEKSPYKTIQEVQAKDAG